MMPAALGVAAAVSAVAGASAQSITGVYHCKHSGTAVCGETCTGGGIIERHPLTLDLNIGAKLISLEGLSGSINPRSTDQYDVIWGFDLGKPTDLTLRVVVPLGVMATLRSPDRENEFICKRVGA